MKRRDKGSFDKTVLTHNIDINIICILFKYYMFKKLLSAKVKT